jgi:hypothetical protein
MLCGLPARDDRLQEHRVFVFDEWHEVHVLLATDHQDALAGVAVGVRMFQDVDKSPRSMWKTMSSNPMPRSTLTRIEHGARNHAHLGLAHR